MNEKQAKRLRREEKKNELITTPDGKKIVKMPKTFATAAYLREEERGVFRLYRDVLVEVLQEDGERVREKAGKSICVSPVPLREFRDGDDEKQVVLRTYHPTEQRPMALVEIQ